MGSWAISLVCHTDVHQLTILTMYNSLMPM